MSVNLTEQEIKELKSRFSSFIVDETLEESIIVHTLSTGRIVKGVVSDNILQIKQVQDFLCG